MIVGFKLSELMPDDIKALDADIQHLENTLNDPKKDWGCEECKQDHIRLLRWLRMLRKLMDKLTVMAEKEG